MALYIWGGNIVKVEILEKYFTVGNHCEDIIIQDLEKPVLIFRFKITYDDGDAIIIDVEKWEKICRKLLKMERKSRRMRFIGCALVKGSFKLKLKKKILKYTFI